jgi:hypothetical protein
MRKTSIVRPGDRLSNHARPVHACPGEPWAKLWIMAISDLLRYCRAEA